MKEGDIVKFNDLAPTYLTKELNRDTYKIGYIDNNGWVFLKEDPGNPKRMLAKSWLKVVGSTKPKGGDMENG